MATATASRLRPARINFFDHPEELLRDESVDEPTVSAPFILLNTRFKADLAVEAALFRTESEFAGREIG
ncbi:hypothetical protein [Mycobacterium noviomagense]|uniref:Uncharacterized protein n=1 Tax=Mycobacterium noviomagense TaxID=459858 RepID=A0A7I7PD16_9MYCO|nr:hypothetical protein [Mycobacterium noviomagense]ORB16552.1 hypothetical protein BST37_06540 [Mycobacterium noviomagense]BBY06480.1 hypothetical protein MNVI_17980 [Mycobacterium noviomagense]